MTITERTLQAFLMRWAMNEKSHEYVAPNNTIVLHWEADLLTFTRSGFIHEFECKLNIYDYRADFKKVSKHQDLSNRFDRRCPNYFWYATLIGFEIEPPEYAGWIIVNPIEIGYKSIVVRKEAPKLHKVHATEWQMKAAYRCMAHHLRQEYFIRYGGHFNQ